ncbi:MAG: hypothetical protein WCX22_01880 [Methanoregula sp.]
MDAVEISAMSDNSFSPIQNSQQVLTPEGIFLSLYVDALRSLQRTWMDQGDRGLNKEAFNLQIVLLTNMIPDKGVRDRIHNDMDAVREGLKSTEQEAYAEQHAGLTVVTHMIEFLCNSFDLIHYDITGPATSKQYRDAILEIPDFVPPAEAKTEPAPIKPTVNDSKIEA